MHIEKRDFRKKMQKLVIHSLPSVEKITSIYTDKLLF